jgi:hypothetical protein
VSNAQNYFHHHAAHYEGAYMTDQRLRGTRWEAVKEIFGVFEGFCEGNEKYSVMFSREIITSIPLGSIFFGGMDPGRFLITGLCRSQVNGDPFFVSCAQRCHQSSVS